MEQMNHKKIAVIAACGVALLAATALIWRSVASSPPPLSDDLVKRNAALTAGADVQPVSQEQSAGTPGGRRSAVQRGK